MARVIYEDTRQQKGKHTRKHEYWAAHGVEVVRKKLDFGDYMTDGSNVVIDTKKGLQEICSNVGTEHARFVREIERAQVQGYKIVFLIEQPGPVHCVDDIYMWTNNTCERCSYFRALQCDSVVSKCIKYRHRPMTGSTLQKIIKSMHASHGCEFELISPDLSAARICELLGIDA